MLKIIITLYPDVSEMKANEIISNMDKNYDSIDDIYIERSDTNGGSHECISL